MCIQCAIVFHIHIYLYILTDHPLPPKNIQDELNKMKGLLGKGTAGYLPPGAEAVDAELEALRKEMQQ